MLCGSTKTFGNYPLRKDSCCSPLPLQPFISVLLITTNESARIHGPKISLSISLSLSLVARSTEFGQAILSMFKSMRGNGGGGGGGGGNGGGGLAFPAL